MKKEWIFFFWYHLCSSNTSEGEEKVSSLLSAFDLVWCSILFCLTLDDRITFAIEVFSFHLVLFLTSQYYMKVAIVNQFRIFVSGRKSLQNEGGRGLFIEEALRLFILAQTLILTFLWASIWALIWFGSIWNSTSTSKLPPSYDLPFTWKSGRLTSRIWLES